MAKNSPKVEINLDQVTVVPFDPALLRKPFSCGEENIDNFLRKSSPDQHKKCKSRVYYAVLGTQIVGFYSVAAASRDPKNISAEAEEKFARIHSAPCIYLGMLGVHHELQGNGIGKKLMIHAMQTTLKVADLVGVYALILDARDPEVAAHYKKWGFEYFVEGGLKMYIPLGTIRSAVPA